MNYVVLDLEWNQSGTDGTKKVESLPFEIIEIGAIKLNEELAMVSEFSELIKPQVYRTMHVITSQLINIQMKELERGGSFQEIGAKFLDWCGKDVTFCTWGTLDLTELQRNMKYYGMKPLSDGPIAYLDAQKLFSLAFAEKKSRYSLEYAVDYFKLEKDIPFHRAFSDAYYTAKVFAEICRQHPEVLSYVSYDVFHPPVSREKEIKVEFDTYMKYISRAFPDRAAAFRDKEVVSSKCYLCHRNLRKKIRWFSVNNHNYECIAYCETHGYLKGKMRVRKTDDGQVYVVKTTRFVGEKEVNELHAKKEHMKELRKKHRKKIAK